MGRWSNIWVQENKLGPVKTCTGHFLEPKGTSELMQSHPLRENQSERACANLCYSVFSQKNEAHLNPKTCLNKKRLIKFFGYTDAIYSKHFRIYPRILRILSHWILVALTIKVWNGVSCVRRYNFMNLFCSTEDNVNIDLIISTLVLIISTKIWVTYDNYTRQGDMGFPEMSKTLPLPKGHSAANFQASLEHTLLSLF